MSEAKSSGRGGSSRSHQRLGSEEPFDVAQASDRRPDLQLLAGQAHGDNKARRLFKDYLTTMGIIAGPLIILVERVL